MVDSTVSSDLPERAGILMSLNGMLLLVRSNAAGP